MLILIRIAFVLLFLMSLAASGFPAEKPGTLSRAKEAILLAQQEETYKDPLGRSTPQGTVIGFLKSASLGDHERALQYLNTKRTGVGAQKLIYDLQAILERGFSGHVAQLSKNPEGNLDDNLPPPKERIGTVETSSGSLDIILERVQRGDSLPIWVFSAATLAKMPETNQEMSVRGIDAYLPKFLVSTWVLWFPLWHWLVILLVIPVTFFLSTLLTRLMTSLFLLYSRRKFKEQAGQRLARLTGPIRILLFAAAIYGISLISQSILTSAFLAHVSLTLAVLGATWLCLRFIDIFFELREERMTAASSERISLVQLGKKLVKILAVMTGALLILYMAGINLTAVIAGLGVGGIAVAFAAQKTLENLFGGITIVSDQPIRVGDFCRVGEYLGTVQAVGLRSTRIRTLARTIVSIPNGQLSLMNLENFTLRDKIWFNHTIRLRHETSTEQLRYILDGIREILHKHPKVESPSARVRFIGFGISSLDLEVFAYVLESEHGAFLHIQEDLLLRIMEVVEGSGSGFALPSQTTYLAQDPGLNAGKTEKAILKVREWREKEELPFPDFSPETIARIRNQPGSPPADSALGSKKKE
jgi:MscS family membrane protein